MQFTPQWLAKCVHNTCTLLCCAVLYCTLLPGRHGDELPLEIERLWRTLAHNRHNIIPMLDFLASLGTHMAYQVGGMQPALETPSCRLDFGS